MRCFQEPLNAIKRFRPGLPQAMNVRLRSNGMTMLPQNRRGASLLATAVIGSLLLWAYPFPGVRDPMLSLIYEAKPGIFLLFSLLYALLLFSTPYLLLSALLSSL